MPQHQTRTAFLTGGTGFVGLNIAEQLKRLGWRVVALRRGRSDIGFLRHFADVMPVGDLGDLDSLLRAMPEAPDAVFHTAANTSVWRRDRTRQWLENVEGTANVITACQARGARMLVYTSSWTTFGLEQPSISESSVQTGNQSWIGYTRSKWHAEQRVRAAVADGLPAVILNPSHIVGRYDSHNWGRFFFLLKEGRLPGIPPGAGLFCHAEQVALAHIAAAERGRAGDNYLLGGVQASFAEFIGLIASLMHVRAPKRIIPALAMRALARMHDIRGMITGLRPEITPEGVSMVLHHPRVDSDKAARELGFRTIPLQTMLIDAHAWLKSQGWG